MKRKLFLLGALALLVAGGVFWSCQKDELMNFDEGVMLKLATVYDDCYNQCIKAGSGDYFYKTDTKTISWGKDKNTKVVDLKYYNTETHFVIEFKSTHSPQNLYIDGNFVLEYNGSENTWITHSIPLNDEWEACDLVEHLVRIEGQGNPVNFDIEYNLIGLCTDCNDANFSYDTRDNLEIIFSYNHDVEAELTISFTFPQVQDVELNSDGKYVGEDGKLYDVNNSGNQTVLTWTGVVGCLAVNAETFHFIHTADCGKASNDGKANIWTDAKIIAVNGVALVDDELTQEIDESEISLKGELPNIVYRGCPTK